MLTKIVIASAVAVALASSTLSSTSEIVGTIAAAGQCDQSTFKTCVNSFIHSVTNKTVSSVDDFLKDIGEYEMKHGGAKGFAMFCG